MQFGIHVEAKLILSKNSQFTCGIISIDKMEINLTIKMQRWYQTKNENRRWHHLHCIIFYYNNFHLFETVCPQKHFWHWTLISSIFCALISFAEKNTTNRKQNFLLLWDKIELQSHDLSTRKKRSKEGCKIPSLNQK